MAIVESTPTKMAGEGKAPKVAKSDNKNATKNKDLQKTRLCAYFLEGKCGYGSNCTFAHSLLEVKSVPDLTKTQLCAKFAEGKCNDPYCSFAHGEAELRELPNIKKKMCKWHSKGKCRNGAACGFAHEVKELRLQAPPGLEIPAVAQPEMPLKKTKAPPGLTKMSDEIDCDASTDVPSSLSQADTDLSSPGGTTSTPEEQFFRFMAGRGSAPLEKQVTLMSGVINGLQSKLAHLEDMMLQTQVMQMQQQIEELSAQCNALETGISMAQPQMSEPTSLKSRLSARAAPFVPMA